MSRSIEDISSMLRRTITPMPSYDIRTMSFGRRRLILVIVEEGAAKPYRSNMSKDRGAVYIRQGRNTFLATEDEAVDLRWTMHRTDMT